MRAESENAPKRDHLLECVKFIARYYERSASDDVLLAGLPKTPGELLTPSQARTILGHLGLDVHLQRFEAAALTAADLPAIAWLNPLRPVVIATQDTGGVWQVFDPEHNRTGPASKDLLQQISGPMLRIEASLGAAERFERKDKATGEDWLWRLASGYWRDYAYIILATSIVNLLALASPLFTMNVYDRVLPNKAFSTLMVLALGTLIALGFDWLLRQARSYLVDSVAKSLDLRISQRLFDKLLNAPISKLDVSTGWMSSRISEYEQVRDFVSSTTMIYFVDVVFSIIFVLVIAVISPWLALVPLVFGLLLLVSGYIAQHNMNKDVARAERSSAHRHALMTEIVAGLDTIKSTRAEGVFLKRWNDVSIVAVNASTVIKRRLAVVSNFSYFVQISVSVVIVVVGAFLFDAGTITMGGIIAATILGGRIIAPMGQVALMLARVRHAIRAHRNLTAIMMLPDERLDERSRIHRPVDRWDIEFADVDFRYQPDLPSVLKGFNLKIGQGEKVAILGRMGSGKTTIGRLLARLYEPNAGVVRLGGIDLASYHPHELRRAVAFATNDALIFEGTIRENVILAHPDADDADLLKASTLSGLDALVQGLKAGYETNVGERGRMLSSGQRQTLGLARAFMEPHQVYVLDDPTSNMDNAAEKVFVSNLKSALPPDSTLIVTTHKNALLGIVDRVIVIENAHVVADGPVRDVLARLAAKA